MPIYEYRCQECQQIFEQWQKDFSDQDKPCPVCSSPSQRLISNTSFILKGSGWYVTDYSKNASSSGGNGAKAGAAEDTSSSAAKEPATKTVESASSTSGSSASTTD